MSAITSLVDKFLYSQVVLCTESAVISRPTAGRWPLFLDSSRRWANRYNVPRVGRNLFRWRHVRLANLDYQSSNTTTSENYRTLGRHRDSLLVYSSDAIPMEHFGHLLSRISNCVCKWCFMKSNMHAVNIYAIILNCRYTKLFYFVLSDHWYAIKRNISYENIQNNWWRSSVDFRALLFCSPFRAFDV